MKLFSNFLGFRFLVVKYYLSSFPAVDDDDCAGHDEDDGEADGQHEDDQPHQQADRRRRSTGRQGRVRNELLNNFNFIVTEKFLT